MRVDIAQTIGYAEVPLPSPAFSEDLREKSERRGLSMVR